jgi:hypothetical protein
MSNLVDAYKRSELEPRAGLGLFTLSSILSDLAEPSESLRATTVCAIGLSGARHLLSSVQLERFRRGEPLAPEGRRAGAARRLLRARRAWSLAPGETRRWRLVADIGRDHAGGRHVGQRPAAGGDLARARVAADLERSGDALAAHRRQRRRLPVDERPGNLRPSPRQRALQRHARRACSSTTSGSSAPTSSPSSAPATARPARGPARLLRRPARPSRTTTWWPAPPRSAIRDLERLCRTYLPLAFSRRHGDPSRPWNRFAIRVRHGDGRLRLDYQGNWRDIFQNWEALAYAFPGFMNGMIGVFLGATTADGYNPYRVTRDGIEWEVPSRARRGPTSATGATTRSSTCRSCWRPRRASTPGRSRICWTAGSSATRTCPTASPVRGHALGPLRHDRVRRRARPPHRGGGGAEGTDARLLEGTGRQRRPRVDGREAAPAAARQAGQPRARGRHLDEHPAARVERRQQRPGRQGALGRHDRLPPPHRRLPADAPGRPRRRPLARGAVRSSTPCTRSCAPTRPTWRAPSTTGGGAPSWTRSAARAAPTAARSTSTASRAPRVSSTRRRWPPSSRSPGRTWRTRCAPTAAATRSTTPTTCWRSRGRLRRRAPPRRDARGPGRHPLVGPAGRRRGARTAREPAPQPPLPRRPAQLRAVPRPRPARLPGQEHDPARARRDGSALLAALVDGATTRIVVRDENGDVHFHGASATARACGGPWPSWRTTSAGPRSWPPRATRSWPSSRRSSTTPRSPAAPAPSSPTRAWAASTGTWSRSCCWRCRRPTSAPAQRASRPRRSLRSRPRTKTSARAWGSTRPPPSSAPSRPTRTRTRRPTPAPSSRA